MINLKNCIKKTGLLWILACFTLVFSCNSEQGNSSSKKKNDKQNKFEFQDGDIIFQISQSRQSKAIQLATKSSYSHVGIVFNNVGKTYVFEAVQPVKITPLESFINNGKNKHFVVKRLIEAKSILNTITISKMKTVGQKYLHKNYDVYFEWTDDNIYCSELVWKIYKEAVNIEIGHLSQLSDFDLSSNYVKEKLKERFGEKIPLQETVIAPESIFNSDLLETIFEN